MIVTTPTVPTRPHLEAFFARVDPVRGRLIFALDATALRQPTWDMAAKLTGAMFMRLPTIGGLDVQLIYFRGWDECVASRWLTDARPCQHHVAGHVQRLDTRKSARFSIMSRNEHAEAVDRRGGLCRRCL